MIARSATVAATLLGAAVAALLALAAIVQALRGKIPDEAQSADEPLLPGAIQGRPRPPACTPAT